MSRITETNQQYYQGSQNFRGNAGNTAGQTFTTTFNTACPIASSTAVLKYILALQDSPEVGVNMF